MQNVSESVGLESDRRVASGVGPTHERVDYVRVLPFIGLHLACLGVFVVGVSPAAIAVAVALYLVRMFCITGFYHRYFSHRTFRTSRAMQFIMAALTCTAGQRGPIWWAAQHRHHHKHSDDDVDRHSPVRHGLVWAHVCWFLTPDGFATPPGLARDWERYPELRFFERFDWLPVVALAVFTFALGAFLGHAYPQLGTSGMQMLVWGFVVSTVVVYHATYTINSLAHTFGSRRYETGDDSRNNFWLALITLGEGWHNNHHRYPASVRQGFFWWEIDLTYYGLKLLAAFGLIRDLRPVPKRVIDEADAQQPARVSSDPQGGGHA